MGDSGWTFVFAVIMIVGLIGTIVPVLPGLVVIWVAALLYGFLVGFGPVGIVTMVVLSLLLAASFASGVLVPRKMAEGEGVSPWSQLVAVLGAVIGLFTIPFVGVIVGALIGLFIAELVNHQELAAAWRATLAVAKGFGVSTLIDIGLAVLMIATWSAWAFTVVF